MKPFLPKPLLVRAGHSRQSSGGSSGSSGSSNKSSATASSKLSASPTPSYSTYASLSPKSQVLAFRLDADAHPAPPLPPAVRIQEEQLARPLPPSPVSAPAMLYQRKAEVAQRRYDQLHAEYENLETLQLPQRYSLLPQTVEGGIGHEGQSCNG